MGGFRREGHLCEERGERRVLDALVFRQQHREVGVEALHPIVDHLGVVLPKEGLPGEARLRGRFQRRVERLELAVALVGVPELPGLVPDGDPVDREAGSGTGHVHRARDDGLEAEGAALDLALDHDLRRQVFGLGAHIGHEILVGLAAVVVHADDDIIFLRQSKPRAAQHRPEMSVDR